MKRILQSTIASLGTISVLAFAPVLLLGSPARAQAVDGRFDEYYEVDTYPTLEYGVTDPAVQDVQIFLDELGYYDNSYGITGTYDDATVEAVEAFQADYDLDSDGIVDEETWVLFINIDQEGIYESDDYFDEETGIYTDYEEDEYLDYQDDPYGY